MRLLTLIIGRSTKLTQSHIYRDTNTIMDDAEKKYYSMEFFEEDGKTFVVFYNQDGNLVAKQEIPHQDVTEAIRLNGDKN